MGDANSISGHHDEQSQPTDIDGSTESTPSRPPDGPPRDDASSAGATPKRKPSNPKGPKYEAFEDLLRHVYSRKGQPVTLAKKDAVHLADQAVPDELLNDLVPELARADRVLAVPAQFLLAGVPHRPMLKLWRQIERTYFIMLQHHPGSARLLELLHEARSANKPAWSALDVATDDRDVTSLPAVDPDKPLKKADRLKLQHNLVFNVVVWLNQFASVNTSTIVRKLHNQQWSHAIASVRKPLDRLKLLHKLTDYAAAGMASSAFAEEAQAQTQAAEDAAQREMEAATALAESEERVQALEQKTQLLSSDIQVLQTQLEQAKQKHEADMIHAANDLEQLRSRVVRAIESEVDLLQEGLAALRRDPPKTHVMDDHAERAINGLRAAINSLNDGGNS